MGSTKKTFSEKKKEIPDSSEVAKPQRVSGKSSKENEIDAIFGKKKRNGATENQDVLAEDDGIRSRSSSRKKKKVKGTTSSVDEDAKVKAGKQSRGDGKARKSSSLAAAAAEPGLRKPRKKTVDGLTVYGEDELKWNNKDAGGTPLCPFDCECCF